jgi:hypothetical protein
MDVRGKHHNMASSLCERDLLPIVQETGWDLEPVWTDVENVAPPRPFSL